MSKNEKICVMIDGVEFINSSEFVSASNYLLAKKEVKRYSSKNESVIRGLWLGALYQNYLLRGYLADIRLEFIDKKIGYGIFANRDIKEGAYIGEYVGEIKRYLPLRYRRNDYVGELRISEDVPLKFIIDAEKKGNLTRFINHSPDPNLHSLTIINKGMMHAIFVAKRPILKNNQLTYNYGDAYWRKREPPAIIN
jgi:SET domain-containing protein